MFDVTEGEVSMVLIYYLIFWTMMEERAMLYSWILVFGLRGLR